MVWAEKRHREPQNEVPLAWVTATPVDQERRAHVVCLQYEKGKISFEGTFLNLEMKRQTLAIALIVSES